MKSSSIALLHSEGLSREDIRTATALVHCRFRGLFSGISHENEREGGTILVVWGIHMTPEPLLKISRWNDRYVCLDCKSNEVLEADCLGVLLNDARARYRYALSL